MVRHDGKYVSYLRVSTGKQARSGLGLEAQRTAVTTWLNGGRWKLVDEVVEIESGKSDKNRPALQRALDACRRYKARLIISRLDRLSRDPVFLLSLRDAGIDFVALDMPSANRMMVGIMAMVAEQEREALSQRTKDALAAKKAQGVKLGGLNAKGIKNRDEAKARAEALRPIFEELETLSARAIAAELNNRAIPTPNGGPWHSMSVLRVKARLAKG